MAYAIGDKTWFRGDLVTITSEPYQLHGGEFQDAMKEDGTAVVMATPEHRAEAIQANVRARKEQQAGFRRLRKGR